MSDARPSTIAVLPTPGSPISTGLFLVRRDSTCMTRSISFSRPMTGSSFFSRASWVRLRPNWSSTSEPLGCCSPAAPPPWPACALLLARVAREELDDLLTDAREVGAQLHQHLRGDAFAFADQPEEDVLGADVVVAELERLAQRELEDLLGAGGEGDVAGRSLAAVADDLLDLRAHGLEGDAERLERLRGDALALVDQTEQDVLGTDVVVVEQARFFLRQDDHSAGSVGEAFEHLTASLGGVVSRLVRGSRKCTPRFAALFPHVGAGRSPLHGRVSSRTRPDLGFVGDGPGAYRGHPMVSLSTLELAPLATDMDRVEGELRGSVDSEDRFLGEVAQHLVSAGGKRLRPALTLCAAYAAEGAEHGLRRGRHGRRGLRAGAPRVALPRRRDRRGRDPPGRAVA